jgi:predicted nucleotidyltransferase
LIVRFDDVTELLAALERHGVRYVLIGSMAMAAQGISRATEDIDFFVEPTPSNVERLKQATRRRSRTRQSRRSGAMTSQVLIR